MFDALTPIFEYVSPFAFTLVLLHLLVVVSILCNYRTFLTLYHGVIVYVIKPNLGGVSLLALVCGWTLLCLELILITTAGYVVGMWVWPFWCSLFLIPGWWFGLLGLAYIWMRFIAPEIVNKSQQRAERKALLDDLRARLSN